MQHFKEAAGILQTLQEHGFEAYFVGGSVRDYVLGRGLGDIDIATSALPEEVMELFPRHIPVGLQHGTVVVLQKGIPYEITTFRVEGGYDDFRRPNEVIFVRSLEEDLKRRDFTMNAMAMRQDGTIVDPFGGRAAIEKRLIQTVGAAQERFQEDALRMMRGIRFMSTLGFSLCPDTKAAILQQRHLLQHIAMERITAEFEKLLLGPAAAAALTELVATRLYEYLPHIEQRGEELLQLAAYDWTSVQTEIEAWAFLIFMTGNKPEDLCRSWKLSNRKLKEISAVVHMLPQRLAQPWDAGMLYRAGEETAVRTARLAALLRGQPAGQAAADVRRLYAQLPIHSRQELHITGKDLLQWSNRPPGPWVAEVLAAAEEAVVYGRLINDKNRVKEWLVQCNLLFDNNC